VTDAVLSRKPARSHGGNVTIIALTPNTPQSVRDKIAEGAAWRTVTTPIVKIRSN